METNEYMKQLLMYEQVQKVCRLICPVSLLGAVLLLFSRVKKGGRKGRLITVFAAVFLIMLLGIQQVYGEEAVTAEFRIAGGNPGADGGYYSAVTVEAVWRIRDFSGSGARLGISRSFGNSYESLELDPGYGTSVTAQLQSLGINWLTILSESGSSETEGGKSLQFSVWEPGHYSFQGAGRSISFIIGDVRTGTEDSSAPMPSTGGQETMQSDHETSESEEEAVEEEEESDRKAPEAELHMTMEQTADGRNLAVDKKMRIRVTEEHFDTSCVPEVRTEVKKGWSFSGWKETEAGAEAVISFKKDGEYEVIFQCQDLSGNQSEKVRSGVFTLDQTPPEIRIRGAENGAVYTDAVSPLVSVSDRTICTEQLSCTLKGAKTGAVILDRTASVKEGETADTVSFGNSSLDRDDVYTLSVKAEDLAGNTAEEEIIFAMDQNGSSYILSDETQALVEAYYISEPIDLVLSEINTSPVEYQISISRDGVPEKLEEDSAYSVEVRGGDGDWMIYVYRIFAENFKEDGVYHVDITSRDQGANVNNSQVRGARIDFVVDSTGSRQQPGDEEEGANSGPEERDADPSAEDGASEDRSEEPSDPKVLDAENRTFYGKVFLIVLIPVLAAVVFLWKNGLRTAILRKINQKRRR